MKKKGEVIVLLKQVSFVTDRNMYNWVYKIRIVDKFGGKLVLTFQMKINKFAIKSRMKLKEKCEIEINWNKRKRQQIKQQKSRGSLLFFKQVSFQF